MNNLIPKKLKAGEGIFGTDESEFVRIMVSRSFSQLKATFVEYEKISGHPIEVAIKKETSGDLKNALISFGKFSFNVVLHLDIYYILMALLFCKYKVFVTNQNILLDVFTML